MCTVVKTDLRAKKPQREEETDTLQTQRASQTEVGVDLQRQDQPARTPNSAQFHHSRQPAVLPLACTCLVTQLTPVYRQTNVRGYLVTPPPSPPPSVLPPHPHLPPPLRIHSPFLLSPLPTYTPFLLSFLPFSGPSLR